MTGAIQDGIAEVPAHELEGWRRRLVDRYREVFTQPPWSESEESVRWFDSMLAEHGASSGFRCVIAVDGDDLVGFAIGTDLEPQAWWHRRIVDALGDAAARWTLDAWFLAELAVGARWRGRGTGALLHDAVLRGLSNPTAVLLTHAKAEHARRLYERKGWIVLHDRFTMWRGGEPMLLMGLDLLA